MNLPYKVILASKSPRRQELLKSLELDFSIKVRSIDESFPSALDANKVAEYIAIKKSEAFNDLAEDELLLTSDTVVKVGDQILGKAETVEEAAEMLSLISGKSHEVMTGVCLKTKAKTISFSETTIVHFKQLSQAEIDHYIATYKPFDKAGAYGIQEWIGMIGITKIEGDYYNVMGLPLQKLYKVLLENF
ncbi:Maf family nucleotide pyrophosphatase [Roseivirga pacifica]|uniref:Maf family nucleotide pyrophosphatase n=1 Tax=Roseivirga pacifica TaxID=1267423 RepID=UPI00227D164F|nr:Maf family nucleotide pyrophosphatase [Roseivirga pacifica]